MNTNGSAETIPTINHVLKMVDSMRSDIHQIHSRINLLERSLADLRNQQLKKKVKITIQIKKYFFDVYWKRNIFLFSNMNMKKK